MNRIEHTRQAGVIVETRIQWGIPLNYGDEQNWDDTFTSISEGNPDRFAAELERVEDDNINLRDRIEELEAELASAEEQITDLKEDIKDLKRCGRVA